MKLPIDPNSVALVQTEPETVAHHYSEADNPERAIKYWHQAGSRSRKRSAHVETIANLTKALEIQATLPENTDSSENELELLLAIGPSYIAVKGYAAQEVERTYSKARVLSRQMGGTTQYFRTLWGLWGYHVVRANHQEARKVGEELLKLTQGENDAIYSMESHLTLGGALFCLADFAQASEVLEEGSALYNRQHHRSHTSLFAADLGVFCSAWASHPLWHIGFPDRALAKSREAVKLAEDLAHPFSMAIALDYAAILHQFRREAELAYQRAEAAIIVCTEHKYAYYLGWARIIKGWALADFGNHKEGRTEIQQGLETLRDTGARRSLPYYLSLLAESYGKNGQVKKGLQVLSEAFLEVENIKEQWWEAELYRLKGDLLLQQSKQNAMQAEASFHRALEVARNQNSMLLELRATVSLCRLERLRGMHNNSYQMLLNLYKRFTEGFDSNDLKATKNLIDEVHESHILST